MAAGQGWGLGELVGNKTGVNTGVPLEPAGSVARVPEIEGVFVGEPELDGVTESVDEGVGVVDGEGQIGVICLMRLLPASPMKRVLAELTVMPLLEKP